MKTNFWPVAIVIAFAGSAVTGFIGMVSRLHGSPQPHGPSIDGLMTGARTLDLKAIQRSLPLRIRNARRLVIITDSCSCKRCPPFFAVRNDTNLPGLLVTDATAQIDRPDFNLTIASPSPSLLSEEMNTADRAGLLIDFVDGTVVVAKGPFETWSGCLHILQDNASAYKVKL